MPTLSRQLVDASAERKPTITPYTIPAPDGVGTVDVFCRDMDSTPYSYLDLVDSLTTDSGKPIPWRQKHMGELVAVHSLCDADGELLFDEAYLKTAAWRKTHTAFKSAVVQVARKHNGLQLGEIGAAEKNSDAADTEE